MKPPPNTFSKATIQQLSYETPYFLFDRQVLAKNLADYRQALPEDTEICYAMKANSEEPVLKFLNEQGCSFEVASVYELASLKKIGVKPERIIYGTAVKPEDSITEFYECGVRRYAFDAEAELMKIARQAPGSQVFLRLLVDDQARSVFTMSEKFGAPLSAAAALLAKASEQGLQPYGLSFNVGSQAGNVEAWANGLRSVKSVMEELQSRGITIQMIDIGGGFPFNYPSAEHAPRIMDIGQSLRPAMEDLPYPVKLIAEPGRGLVADAYVLVTSVFAKNKRSTGHWLYLDAGAYNALLEVMAYQGSIQYQVELLRDSNASQESYILTGPTGDSLDIIGKDTLLPSDVKVGDKLVIRDTGAYSFTLATAFNGFPVPPWHEG